MDKLSENIKEKKNYVCLGMDPRFSGKASIPDFLIKESEGDFNKIILEFNSRLLEEVSDLVAVIKPQIAYYEAYDAMDALKKTIDLAKKKGLLIILDAKRNDIGSTSEAYAKAIFENYDADMTTINPYLGTDCVAPFLKREGKGSFILVKTSNPSSIEFQDLFSTKLEDVPGNEFQATIKEKDVVLERNYIKVARLVLEWNQEFTGIDECFGRAGAVIGATFPEQLKHLRALLKEVFFLIPGYGAQGATVGDIKHGFDDEAGGAVVNSSRGLLYAYTLSKNNACKPEKFATATRNEIIQMNESIASVLARK
ncbi:MAG: orotidine-5'-phosphate decarboxylase [Candidatus Hodarchaeota archaeon]